MMTKEQKIFKEHFDLFIKKLVKLFNVRLLTTQEVKQIDAGELQIKEHSINPHYLYDLMKERFEKLLSLGMGIDEAIEFIFKPINFVAEIQRLNQWRKPKKEVEPYLQMIKYRIENNCSEYEAFEKIAHNNGNLEISGFRKWYNTPKHRLLYPEIYTYLKLFPPRKNKKRKDT